jgi:DUF218 domain
MKRLLVFLFLITACCSVWAQAPNAGYQPVGNGSVQAKNFYLLTLIQHNDKVRRLVENDSVLNRLAILQNRSIKQSLENFNTYTCITAELRLNDKQIHLAMARLIVLYYESSELQNLVNNELITSNAYSHHNDMQPVDQLVSAWRQDALAINHTIAVYGDGEKPNYPNIDSISFNVHSPQYIQEVKQLTQQVIAATGHSSLFFMPSMTAALAFLNVNGRNDAGDHEPMELTVNKAALQKVKEINWANYNYTVLLIPGEGPEGANTPISNGSKNRCRIAAAVFHQANSAPFIMVSGGKVHPYKTPYYEATEMKRFLIDSLQIPDNAIILEPHARHTTTNMRNGARLLMLYSFPLLKPALVVSDSLQSAYISGMKQRCIDELGDVPYKLGTRISANSQEFYAVPVAGQINPTEPLDP